MLVGQLEMQYSLWFVVVWNTRLASTQSTNYDVCDYIATFWLCATYAH